MMFLHVPFQIKSFMDFILFPHVQTSKEENEMAFSSV